MVSLKPSFISKPIQGFFYRSPAQIEPFQSRHIGNIIHGFSRIGRLLVLKFEYRT